uniref:Uncharacterized protein n=1 Tax=Anguilla anguilla TaxID=7936 RepID=A0A0E9PDJ6_ANGAN
MHLKVKKQFSPSKVFTVNASWNPKTDQRNP